MTRLYMFLEILVARKVADAKVTLERPLSRMTSAVGVVLRDEVERLGAKVTVK